MRLPVDTIQKLRHAKTLIRHLEENWSGKSEDEVRALLGRIADLIDHPVEVTEVESAINGKSIIQNWNERRTHR